MTKLPFQMPDPFSFGRRVFAHYFYPFPLSIGNQPAADDYYNAQYLAADGEGGKHLAYGGYLRARPLPVAVGTAAGFQLANMRQEVEMAIARGITGFTFDLLSLTDAQSPTGHLAVMLAAAAAVNTRFVIVPMLDMSAMVGLTQAQAVQLIAGFTHPSFLRIEDGRLLVTAFNASLQPLAWWQGVITALNAQGHDIAFIPVMLGSPTTSTMDPISLGTGGWGTATPAGASARASYLTPVLPQQFRPKSQVFWEAGGFDTFRNGWASAIAGTGPYVQMITWSDFSESGQIQPYTDETLDTDIGTAFYDLTAFYATWFMSGVEPTITEDVLYWGHRRMASTVAHLNQVDRFSVVYPPAEIAIIELLAFLTEPGVLIINGQALAAAAGITSFKVPATPGNPKFALQRNGSNVLQGVSPITIYGPQGSPSGTLDLTYWGGSFSKDQGI